MNVGESSLAGGVERSKHDREAMLRKFGFIPTSVLRLRRGERSRRLFNLPGERASGIRGADSMARLDVKRTDVGRERADVRRAAGLFGAVSEAAEKQGRQVGSVMAAELVEFVCRYYSRAGQMYLDPFAGHGVRAQVAWSLSMPYIGMDVSAEYVRYIEAVAARLADVDTSTQLMIIEGDSRHPDAVPDGIGDVSFTSPPYWDVEYYGPEPEQLGTVGVSYDSFLTALADVYAAWRPKFRTGAWVVVNVNDIRRDGRFYPYHADLIGRLAAVGYEPHDIWIVDGLVAQLPKAFGVSFNMKRIAPKVHEYLLVFRAA